jgi:hypothetical protein
LYRPKPTVLLTAASVQHRVSPNEISRRIFGLDFFASAQELKSNIGAIW